MLLTSENSDTEVKKITEQSSRTLLPVVLVWIVGIIACIFIYYLYNNKMGELKANFQTKISADAKLAAQSISSRFESLFNGLNTISRLPGVINMYEPPMGLNKSDKDTVQELYSLLYSYVALSEIYIVPLGFDPHKLDDTTGEMQIPTVTYDEHIVGKTAVEERTDVKIAEIEIYEYEQMQRQLLWFQKQHPKRYGTSSARSPVLISEEVLTCDNSQYSLSDTGDHNRSGLVYSVPIYDRNNNLSGLISGVFLTNVLRSFLPNEHYSIKNVDSGERISTNKKNSSSRTASNDYLYSENLKLNMSDAVAEWQLQVDYSKDDYWNKAEVKSMQTNFITVFSITIFLTSIIAWLVKNQKVK